MDKLLQLKTRTAVILYVIIDEICIAAGMGVPILCILLGFPLGWYITKRTMTYEADPARVLNKIMKHSFLAAAFTFVTMLLIWGRVILMFFDPKADFRNFGHPFILYDPKLSLIGWLVLIIIISPFLQLMASVFASYLTLMRIRKK
jgi:prolipoprotein diacylglyceryltransferase